MEELGQGQDKDIKPVLKFEEDHRGLVLNQTNWGSIEAIHGVESDMWIGKRITLYVDPNVMFGGKRVPAIRVRPMVSKQSPPGLMSYEEAVQFCMASGVQREALNDHLKACGITKYNPQLCTPLVRKFIADLEPPDSYEDVPLD